MAGEGIDRLLSADRKEEIRSARALLSVLRAGLPVRLDPRCSMLNETAIPRGRSRGVAAAFRREPNGRTTTPRYVAMANADNKVSQKKTDESISATSYFRNISQGIFGKRPYDLLVSQFRAFSKSTTITHAMSSSFMNQAQGTITGPIYKKKKRKGTTEFPSEWRTGACGREDERNRTGAPAIPCQKGKPMKYKETGGKEKKIQEKNMFSEGLGEEDACVCDSKAQEKSRAHPPSLLLLRPAQQDGAGKEEAQI